MNETWDYEGKPQIDSLIRIIYELTKKLDPTRPCVDASGNFHVKTDIFDLRDYDQNPETFRERYEPFKNGGALDTVSNTIGQGYVNRPHIYRGEPVCISEYGGIKWDVDGGIVGWGYGNAPKSEEEFIERYIGLTNVILENPNMFGFCYTQLYDVEQEKNGLYTYGRVPKFDIEIFRQVNTQKAAIED